MRRIFCPLLVCFMLCSLPAMPALAQTPSANPVPGDLTWDDAFAIPGLSSAVSYNNTGFYPYTAFVDEVNVLLTAPDGSLYAGGQFRLASGLVVSNIARWDGMRWSTLAEGLTWPVNALAIDSQGHLYAGGKAVLQGSANVSTVARWNGAAWETLATFTNAPGHPEITPDVNALTLDGNDNLFVGGAFGMVNSTIVANGLARFDGSGWSGVGGGVNNGLVYALWSDSVGNLYAGGTFNRIGGTGANGFAYWDRTKWEPVGSGVGWVTQFAVGSSGWIYTVGANGVWRWNTTQWENLNFPYFTYQPATLLLDQDNSLLVGGSITYDGVNQVAAVERWKNGSWTLLGSSHSQPGWGGSGMFKALALNANGMLYVGGVFSEFASLHASNIVRYDGASWLSLGPGQGQIPAYPRLDPTALATSPDGVVYLGATNSYNLAIYRLEDGVLSQLGPTFYSAFSYDNLNALIADPYSGNLYVAGKFDSIGGVTVNNIARWDGQKWQPMQGGLDGRVYALAFDQAGNLYVGGEFYHAGSLAVDGLAIWGPLGWEKPPGGGLACSENCGIKALAWDPVNYRLYIGGVMATPSGWRQVLYWDPFFGYVGISGNPYRDVKTLAVDKNGHLFVGFSNSYSAPPGLAEWDGTTWTTPGSIDQLVYSLASDALGNIYASGQFSQIGSLTVNYIARYDGSQWLAMGSGVSSAPYALAVDSHNQLFAGGYFDGAGSRKVSGLARWSSPPAAQLSLNFTTGQPGSEIAVTGVNFIPNGQASIKVNGQLLDDSFPVAADGSLAFRLSTSQASQGRYLVTVQQNPSASASFTLQDSLPLRKPEAALPVFNIPAGLGLTHLSYLPLLRK